MIRTRSQRIRARPLDAGPCRFLAADPLVRGSSATSTSTRRAWPGSPTATGRFSALHATKAEDGVGRLAFFRDLISTQPQRGSTKRFTYLKVMIISASVGPAAGTDRSWRSRVGIEAVSDGTRSVLITAVQQPATGVLSFTMRDPDGLNLPAWTPGAHVDLVLPSGLVRQYSLCSDPQDLSEYRIAVLREESSRGGSAELHDSDLLGCSLTIRGPRNHFQLTPAQHYLFLAGGIGITPLLPMIRQVSAQGAAWRLVYGGRTRASMAFLDELVEIQGGEIQVVAQDEVGLMPVADILRVTKPDTGIFVCGPPGLLNAVEKSCADQGLAEALHLERFGGPVEGGVAQLDGSRTGAFDIELRSTGTVLTVPADRTVLSVVRDVLPDTPFSCEEGFCGTCETRVLGGVPEHRDTILSQSERDANTVMMICVGRSLSPRLVLDL